MDQNDDHDQIMITCFHDCLTMEDSSAFIFHASMNVRKKNSVLKED